MIRFRIGSERLGAFPGLFDQLQRALNGKFIRRKKIRNTGPYFAITYKRSISANSNLNFLTLLILSDRHTIYFPRIDITLALLNQTFKTGMIISKIKFI